jgi:fucose permease
MPMLAPIFAIFVYGSIAAMLGTILPALSARFHLTPKQNGNIALAQAIGLVIASVSAGPLIDSQGYKTGLVLGLAAAATALFLLPGSKSYASVLLCLFLLGLGGGTIVTGANALAFDLGGSQRAAALNFLNVFFGLGGLATPFVLANLLRGNSTRLCYLTAVACAATLAVNASVTMPAARSAGGIALSEAGKLLGHPALWLLSAMLFLYVACEVGVWNWLTRHLIAQGISEVRALNILSLGFALGLLLGRVAVAPAFKTMRPETVTLVAAVLMTITTWLALQARRPAMAWVAVFCAGVAMAPVFPTVLAIAGNVFGPAKATAMGIVAMFGWIGLAVSSPIIGAIGGDDPRRLKKALLILPASSALMIVVNLVLRSAI